MSGTAQFTGTQEEWDALVKQVEINFIAEVCHEANRVWCRANGDNTQKNWSEAEQWQRDSAIAGVKFRLNNPDAKHDAQHNAWMQDKINDGWV